MRSSPWLLFGMTGSLAYGGTFLEVTPGTNNATITQLVLTVNGTDQTQNTEAPPFGVNPLPASGSTPVLVKSVRITDGVQVGLNLTFFNTSGAAVVNIAGHITGAAGVGVYDNGTLIRSDSNTSAFGAAVAGTAMDTDLRNYSFYDSVTPALPRSSPSPADMDLLFLRSVRMDDYFMVSERWGNSPFTVTALMENGQPYATANVLRLGGPDLASPTTPTGEAYTRYDWNTGYAPGGTDQALALTIFSAKKFFEGTGSQGGPIFGLRIDNNNEADYKILGISANTFADNEENSQVIPEPSAFLLTLAGALGLVFSRRRLA
jgi:hypothetical protein